MRNRTLLLVCLGLVLVVGSVVWWSTRPTITKTVRAHHDGLSDVRVTGRLVDGDSGTPLVDAYLMVTWRTKDDAIARYGQMSRAETYPEWEATTTDQDGRFSLPVFRSWSYDTVNGVVVHGDPTPPVRECVRTLMVEVADRSRQYVGIDRETGTWNESSDNETKHGERPHAYWALGDIRVPRQ